MNTRLKLCAVGLLGALPWASPAAAQVATAASQASSMAAAILAATVAFATLALVITGYFYMAGHGDRQTLALWAAGFIVMLSAPALVAIFL
ncbi:hypothetical protein [Erythrobacter sp. MTPC3]|uniref:hypothetical protein n=1 Tax=Erythrobacter sp. MTPC3 TaxID=3056564 RepID=UPI0036F25998